MACTELSPPRLLLRVPSQHTSQAKMHLDALSAKASGLPRYVAVWPREATKCSCPRLAVQVIAPDATASALLHLARHHVHATIDLRGERS